PGYGAINGAGIKAELVWPLGGSTTYYSGTSTILKECKGIVLRYALAPEQSGKQRIAENAPFKSTHH
ncbi:hypothetical protein KBB06_02915, partial [Candidatus Gracilibacteria bacterium]|nr:hypothetical protein [Candidatus Gracilibacteria bacterium]